MSSNNSNKYVKNISAFYKNFGINKPKNEIYEDRQTQIMSERTSMFDSQRAYLATDYVKAEAQGLTKNFYDWTEVNVRMPDVSSTASSIKGKTDDFKQIIFTDENIDYFPIGAKVKALGNTWICINPSNMSNIKTTAVIARCNASYNSYDYYGNVVVEPIVIETHDMLANANVGKENIVLMNGYFNVTCQLNKNTETLQENSRIILGKKAFELTGVTNFIQEFTGDRNSCHLITFTARVSEPTENDDIDKNFIAGGDDMMFDSIIQSAESMRIGDTIPFLAHFVKNEELIKSTDEHPITWIWGSSDETIAKVDSKGNVTAISDGKVNITATMLQNPNISSSVELLVDSEKYEETGVIFVSVVPDYISQHDTQILKAMYLQDGKKMNVPLQWTFKGAANHDYTAEVLEDRQSVKITCISPSDKKLEVTASYNGYTATAKIALLGY